MGYIISSHPFVYKTSMPGLSDKVSLLDDTPANYENSSVNKWLMQASEEPLDKVETDERKFETDLNMEERLKSLRNFISAHFKRITLMLDIGSTSLEMKFDDDIDAVEIADDDNKAENDNPPFCKIIVDDIFDDSDLM